jgi:predicted deacetylase
MRVTVSLHDVAPQTWTACERLLAAVRQVAQVPVTLLVVPDYHFEGLRRFTAAYRNALEACLARGDELALHGWAHRDTCPLAGGLGDTFRRTLVTAREGEFAALSSTAARVCLEEGVAWFHKHGWPLHGFIPPAWLMGAGAWEAVRSFPFDYTATRAHLHLLPERIAVPTRTFVYSARSQLRRGLSLVRSETLRQLPSGAPAVRLVLHPADAPHEPIVRHFQLVLRTLLDGSVAVTKAQLAAELRAAAATAQRGLDA